jgi:hypothetical protein
VHAFFQKLLVFEPLRICGASFWARERRSILNQRFFPEAPTASMAGHYASLELEEHRWRCSVCHVLQPGVLRFARFPFSQTLTRNYGEPGSTHEMRTSSTFSAQHHLCRDRPRPRKSAIPSSTNPIATSSLSQTPPFNPTIRNARTASATKARPMHTYQYPNSRFQRDILRLFSQSRRASSLDTRTLTRPQPAPRTDTSVELSLDTHGIQS